MARASKAAISKRDLRPVTVKFTLKGREFRKAARHRTRWIAMAVVPLAVAWAIDMEPVRAGAALGIALAIFLMPTLQWGDVSPHMREACEHTFDDAGHTCRSSSEEVRHGWNRFDSYTETSKLFFLHSRSSVVLVIPKRAFASPTDERRFRVLLASHLSTVASSSKSEEQAEPAPRRRRVAKPQLSTVKARTAHDDIPATVAV